jgi:hypothetical protein
MMVVIVRVVHVPEAAMEEDTVETVEAVEPDKAHTAMADEVAATKEVVATKAANGEPVTTEAVTTEAMAAETMATAEAMAAETAGVGNLRQCNDHGDEHCKHQIEQLTTHDTLLCRRFSPVAIDVLG